MLLLRRRLSAGATIVTIVLAGCQPVAPTTPVPAPSFRCTPEAGGAEFDCSQAQYDDMVAKDKLYAEAEAVYRRYLAEDLRIAKMGGVSEPTEELLETTSGDFLKRAMSEYSGFIENGLSVKGGERRVVAVSRLVGASKGGSIVAIKVCADARSVEVLKHGKHFGQGLITEDDLYFARESTSLKVIGADGKEVASCAAE